MLVKTFGSAVHGVDATTISVEVNICTGKRYYIVGLPDSSIREAWQRLGPALRNNGYRLPRYQIIVNLSPADIRKEGSAYDLPMAMGILAATRQIEVSNLTKYIMMGELTLDGKLHPVKGALPIAIKARQEAYQGLILPLQNAREAAMVSELEVYGVSSLGEVVDFFTGRKK